MASKTDVTIIHLEKAKSLLAKAVVMVEREASPAKIMRQIGAVIGLLRAARQLNVKKYLEECSRKAIRIKSPNKRTALFQEILEVAKIYTK